MYIPFKYDTLQKMALISFSQEMLSAMGDERKVVGFYPTELIIPTFRSNFMDGVLELEDGTLMNIEFQTGDINEDFLIRCTQYAINLRAISGRHVESVIVSTGSRINSKKVATISKNFKFEPKIYFYSDLNGSEKLINIKNKIKNQEKLTSKDHYDLIFIPLMGNVNKVKVAFEVFDIVNNKKLFSQDEQSKIKQCQFVVADIVADGDKNLRNKLMERIFVVAEFLIEYEKNLVESSIEKGRKEGRDDGIREVAKNLKDTLSDEDIAERTGLSVEEVKKL